MFEIQQNTRKIQLRSFVKEFEDNPLRITETS